MKLGSSPAWCTKRMMRKPTKYTKASILRWTSGEEFEGESPVVKSTLRYRPDHHRHPTEKRARRRKHPSSVKSSRNFKPNSLTSSAVFRLSPTRNGRTYLRWAI